MTTSAHGGVEELELHDIIALRAAVLRKGMVSASAVYEEDSDPAARHFGIRVEGDVVACSTWIPRPFPSSVEERAMQLKGMAVAEHLQGTGVGSDVLVRGIEHASQAGCTIVWARARNSAIGFYERHGFRVVGDEFVDATTALPHHLVLLRL